MRFAAWQRWAPKLAALGVVTLVFLALATVPRTAWYEALRERAFDATMNLVATTPGSGSVVVVDIDRAALQAIGPWPWSRQQLSDLVRAIAAAKPQALGLDLLIAGPDERSPAALARTLAAHTNNTVVRSLALELSDGDAQLAAALATVPGVLGIALEPEREAELARRAPILVQGRLDVAAFWQARSTIAPGPPVVGSASGLGVLAIAGDRDGVVRRVPLLVVAAGQLVPGLTTEVARVASGASALLVSGTPPVLRVGQAAVVLGPDGMLRIFPVKPERWPARTLSAAELLKHGQAAASRLSGRIVLLGSSAPELGGLRATASGIPAPSVQLHADAVEQVLAGEAPHRPAPVPLAELLLATALGAVAVLIGFAAAPLVGTLIIVALSFGWLVTAVLSFWLGRLLVDPIIGPVTIATCFAVGALAAFAATLQREAMIRRRFEQHLAPEVVRRIIRKPGLLKLEGEMREVTALFTDVEGFTAMTERADPRALVHVLDRYFDEMTQIVVAHCGMVDKIVGDALHVLFNAPLDVADHPRHAIECAKAMMAFSERYRHSPQASSLGFGRTRIGIETGVVIIGDVGGGRKLDYTAHGNAMNTAARLEAANKQLGSAICIGPGAAARLDTDLLRPLGCIAVRGRAADLPVFDLWPEEFGPRDREEFAAAVARMEADPAEAQRAFEGLAARVPDDPVLLRFRQQAARAVTMNGDRGGTADEASEPSATAEPVETAREPDKLLGAR